jgi:putative ubiquitin-RnfH superfamily antitoxin RatB of RatAB toxin-antitoxin module
VSAAGEAPLRVSVALALPEWQTVLPLELAPGSTVEDALRAARVRLEGGSLPSGANPDWDAGAVGIFGVVLDRSRRLQDGDRVELYRPLPTDPKESRRRRARGSGARRRN